MASAGPMMETKDSKPTGAFVTTQWTQVLSARGDSPEAQAALSELCAAYYEFDRAWALALLDRVLNTLAREHAQDGKEPQFETLKPWLTGDAESLSQSAAARELGITEGAVKVAIHRLRKRFREVVKAEIAQTLGDPSEVADELRYLLAVLVAR